MTPDVIGSGTYIPHARDLPQPLPHSCSNMHAVLLWPYAYVLGLFPFGPIHRVVRSWAPIDCHVDRGYSGASGRGQPLLDGVYIIYVHA